MAAEVGEPADRLIGSVRFDSIHPDEFQLYTHSADDDLVNGERTVIVGPEYPSFGHTIPMPARGVGSGYGAAFVAQAQEFLIAIANEKNVHTDFWTGYQTMLVCTAAQRAAADGEPVDIAALDTWLRAQPVAR